jgi:predicted secreted protein
MSLQGLRALVITTVISGLIMGLLGWLVWRAIR